VGVDLDMHDMSRTDGFLPHENDWGKLGKFIGRNTHLTSLTIATLSGNSNFNAQTREINFDYLGGGSEAVEPREKQWKDFCSGLGENCRLLQLSTIHMLTQL
jgi:hypothetical protein